jgi:peptidyl-prolyl cis-trans isomerase D
MLQNIGDKLKGQGDGSGRAHRWFWYLIIGALMLVFAAWGPYTVVDLSFGQGDYAVQVNGEEVPATQINDQWQRQLPQLMEAYGGELSDAQRAELQRELLALTVRELATTQHARALGLEVSDAEAGRAFRGEEAFQIDGQFNVREAQLRLASAGISEQEYLNDLKQRLLTNKLLGVIGVSDFLTPSESRRLLALMDEERQVSYLLINPEDYAGNAPVEPAAIEAYYQSHQEDFAVPESVRLAYAELSLADLTGSVVVSDEEVRERYERDRDQYVQAETRQARHILVSVDDPAQDAARAAVAQDLYQQIQGGADFAALAREHSADTASAEQGGDLGWATRDTYVQAFGDKLFTMNPGEVSEPVKTEFGYHIIKLEGVRPASGRSLEDMRAEIGQQLRNEKSIASFNREQDRLQEQLESGGASLDSLVREFNMRRGVVENFERGAGGLPLGSDAELNREVFSEALIAQRRVGGPVQLSDDRLTVFQVEEHRPASTRALEDVRGEIVAALIRERGATAAFEAAGQAKAQLDQGRSFTQVAAQLKGRAEPARYVSRNAPDLPVELSEALFEAPRPAAGAPVREALRLEDGTVVLFEATDTRVGGQLDIPQLVSLRTQRELQRYTRRDIEAYISALVRDAKVRENPAVFQQ